MEELLSQIVVARKETEEIAKSNRLAEQAWNADRDNFLSLLGRYEKRIEDMSMQNERVLLQYRTEKIVLESKFNESKARTQELLEKIEDDRHLWDSEKGNLESSVVELQTKLDSMASENVLLSQKNRELRTEAEYLKAQFNNYNAALAHLEYERGQNERLLHQYRTEKIDLPSELNESKGRTQDLVRKFEEDRCLWDAEKSNLEGIVAKLQTKLELMVSESGLMTQKNTKLSTEAESSKVQLNVLESELNESKGKIRELLKNNEDDRHLWDKEKKNLEGTLAAQQTNLKSMASERGLLSQKNTKLSTEAKSLKAQLKDYNARLAHLECEREKSERLLHQSRTEKIDLQSEFDESKGRTEDLVRRIEEDRCLWAVEKSNLEGVVAKLQTNLDLMASESGLMTQENTKLSTEAESSKGKLNVLEAELNESKGKIHDLLKKNEEDRHLWDKEKEILEDTLAALQTNLKLIASERGLLSQKNAKLSTDAKSLKAQLNDYNARLAHLECEREKNERLLHRCRTEKIDLQSEYNESKGKTQNLVRRIEEDRCLWGVEKSNLEGVVAKLQKKFNLMASESGLMTQKNTKLTSEAEPSKGQLNVSESELNESKGKIHELLKKYEKDRHLWDEENKIWEGTLAELQTNLELMASERGLLSQKNRELSTEAKSLKAQLNEYNATLAHLECEREKNERLLHQCRTEKIDLQSKLNESKGTTQDLVGKIEDDRCLWGIEKSHLDSVVAKLQKELDLMASESGLMTQKNTKLSTEAESLKSQLNALESQLNESNKKTQELLKKLEDDRHLWDGEKKILEGTHAELQTNLELMASERGLLSQKNRELSTEEKSLKAQLNHCNARLFHMESEREKNERLSHQCRTEKIDLQSELNESKGRTGDLVREIEEGRCLWVAEKSDLEGVVAKLQQKLDLMVSESGLMVQKNTMLSTESKSLKSQLNALESKLNESMGKTQELQKKLEDDQHLWDEEKKILEGTLAELQTNLELMVSERELLSQKNRELSTEEKSLKAQLNDCNARLSHLECEREKNERLLHQCRTEKTNLQSKLNESKGNTQDLVRKIEEDHCLWVAEKSNLEGIVAKLKKKLDLMASESGLMTQKNTKLSTEAESLNSQLNALESKLNALESKLNESKRENHELLKQLEDDRDLWDKEKKKLEGTLAEQQTHLELMASERGSMGKMNMELSNELEFLKTQVSEYNTTLVYMQGERRVLKDLFASNEGRLEVLLTTTATMENEINSLQQQVNDGVKQHSDLTQQYKVREHSLKQQNGMLKEEVVSTRCLLETQNQRVEELIVENGRLNKQVEELSKRIIDLQATHIKVQEKEEERMAFESLHAEVAKKYRQIEEKHFKLLKENEEQGKMIESLKGENASLGSEKFFLLQSLKEETKRSEEISKKCLKNDQRVLDLESQSLGLHTELTATKLKCDGITTRLNQIKEDMKKLSNDSCQIREEKESLHAKLLLEISRNKALEEELLSTKSSLEEMKESASKGERQIAKLHCEILAVAKEKDGQIIDIQSHLLAIVEEKESQLAGLQDQLSSLAAAKIFLDEENNSLQTELDKRTLVSKEEKVSLVDRLRDLETALDSLSKDLESSRAIAEEKEGKIVELQYQLSYIAEAKMCLEEKNNSLLTDLDNCTMVSEENVRLQNRIRELETALYSLNKDLESKDVRLQKLKEHKPLQGKSLALENGKPNAVHEKPKPNGGLEKQTPKPVAEKQTPPKPVPEKRTAKQVPEKQKKIWL